MSIKENLYLETFPETIVDEINLNGKEIFVVRSYCRCHPGLSST